MDFVPGAWYNEHMFDGYDFENGEQVEAWHEEVMSVEKQISRLRARQVDLLRFSTVIRPTWRTVPRPWVIGWRPSWICRIRQLPDRGQRARLRGRSRLGYR